MVGIIYKYDEYFALGQSAWCGTKYYPSDTIIKHVDKSINFINDCGIVIKGIQASGGIKVEPKGEQLSAILKYITEVSEKVNKKAKRLWLDNIPDIILVDNLEKKYNINHNPYNLEVVVGEYDAPEKQEQGPVIYNYLKNGNTIIYGNDGSEKENFLNTLIYTTTKNYTVNEVNYYIIDYGSESFRKFKSLPHIGGIVFALEEEKYNNLFKMLKEEIKKRKTLFADYGGEYTNYIKLCNDKIPVMVVIINNYDSVYESNLDIYDDLPELVRDSERYGIVFIITANAINSIQNKITSNFSNIYAYKLKDLSDYSSVFGIRNKIFPREIFGRGLFKNNEIHEFQTASILESNDNLNEYLIKFIEYENKVNNVDSKKIPTLPTKIRYDDIVNSISTINSIPVGISKEELDVVCIDSLLNLGNIITSTKIGNTKNFVTSLIYILKKINNVNLVVIDSMNTLRKEVNNFYNDKFDEVLIKLEEYVDSLIENNSNNNGVILIYGLNKFLNKVNDIQKFNSLINKLKKYEKI